MAERFELLNNQTVDVLIRVGLSSWWLEGPEVLKRFQRVVATRIAFGCRRHVWCVQGG